MNDPPPSSLPPAHLAPPRGRQLRSTSDSPAGPRIADDLLLNLTPRTVVDAFRTPSGTLKTCIDAATPAEQAFALRVATASNNILEWLAELSSWPWPACGGPAGFEMPAEKRIDEAASDSDQLGFIGSLPTADVAKYERRIDEISQGLEDLDIDEIKSQVLNNHIMPLSRPGTPIMGLGRSMTSSLSTITRMDDLAALVTATTVQALPNLSKLTRLLDVWSFRVLVLRKIPVFLSSVADAEVALQSGWNAINGVKAGHTESTVLSREEFDVMRPILERKVIKTGRDLDAMLDMLEGQPDTLPEEWIDRVDALEHGYSEWSVACERKIKEADWARIADETNPVRRPHETNGLVTTVEPPTPTETGPLKTPELPDSNTQPIIKIHPTAEDQTTKSEDECAGDSKESLDGTNDARATRSDSDSALSDISEDDILETEPGLLPRARRGSGVSQSSTVVHESQIGLTDSFSSGELEFGTPERPRRREVELQGAPDLDTSCFPSFGSGARSMSVSFNDKPTITQLPDFPSPPSTPTKSIPEDDVSTAPDSPLEPSRPESDDQLQQQINEILQSVPAKIRLTSEPPALNLNPPDFKMPTARRASKSEAISRSQSNMSLRSNYSRSGTPSFTLAPAYGRTSRPRPQRGNQEIKLYHLSRSNGEAPIKLFIRCVGEHGERVMVRVGGGWADLGEYLKEYATHHRRAGPGSADTSKVVEVATPPSRPASVLDNSPQGQAISPLRLRKTRRSPSESTPPPVPPLPPIPPAGPAPAARPKTPVANGSRQQTTPPSETTTASSRSRSSSRISPGRWDDRGEESELGMAGPRGKQIAMSEESRKWVESVKEKVRIASGERKLPVVSPIVQEGGLLEPGPGLFGEMGKVGSTKRLFRRQM